MRRLGYACTKLRLLPLLCASCLLTPILLVLLRPHHVCAANGDTLTHEDHNYPRLQTLPELLELEVDGGNYESEFVGADRSIIGRAEDGVTALANNAPGISTIKQGSTDFWTFPSKALWGVSSPPVPGLPSPLQGQSSSPTPAAGEKILYISLTTCIQPSPKSANQNGTPDQFKFYVSTSSSNQKPNNSDNAIAVPVDGGFGWLNISVKSDVFIGVFAPYNTDFSGTYNYQLTASIDGFYASYYNEPNGDFIDSDSNTALLYTKSVTSETTSNATSVFQKWMSGPPAFSMFVYKQDDPRILGIQNSYCALESWAPVQVSGAIGTSMTLIRDGQPRQQFHVTNLNGSSSYYATTVIHGNSTASGGGYVNGGGTVWNPLNFTTKSDNNCALVFNLTFCTSVAYAAPSNPTNKTLSPMLGAKYDDYAASLYTNFSRSLAQIPCNTTASAQYSLARTCTDCDNAYRDWLCAVSIPRCEDFSNNASYLQPRAVNQLFLNGTNGSVTSNDPVFKPDNFSRVYYSSSRNPMIDTDIQPGPYKEILPCKDLCYELVRSCPAALQFGCPLEGHGLNWSYGDSIGMHLYPPTCNSLSSSKGGAAVLRGMGFSAVFMAFGTALITVMI
ncbi:hypothetical protein N7G274_008848 [Stereocaulon virgatum]|uniref:Uncharacterized protein n=1 Tax=Stereocaulon virgatum TaxID=373712 RepID=A0ABR4A156_9LECA